MIRVFDERIWARTVRRIGAKQCTPFIGAGASAEYIPLAGDLAKILADQYDYPFGEASDLARVTQFAAVQEGDRLEIKQRLAADIFANVPVPDFRPRDEPHALLADLEFPIYLTTNYDDFMYEALKNRGREPQRVICPWYITDDWEVKEANSPFREAAGYDPDIDNPILYHLHGHHGTPESLVLTEDDYIEFLVRVARNPNLLPPVIRAALLSQMLLFVGFSMADLTFRVIFEALLSTRSPRSRPAHVSVQIPPPAEDPADERLARLQEYLDEYYAEWRISICWQTARDFSAELRRRWESR